MQCLTLVLAILFVAPVAAGERLLDGTEIRSLLVGIVAEGDTTRQTFSPNGDTVFDDGRRQTTGRWRIENDAYCSRWPPGGGWRCYRVRVERRANEPDLIIWVDAESGARTVNRLLPKDR